MEESALEIWRQKLTYLQKEEALAFDKEEKSEIREQIEEARARIRELELAERYRIVERLGAGGGGEVWKAEDVLLGEKVALKFPTPGREDDPRWQERFFAEVRAARRVDHPNVCRVHDVGLAGGRPFLSMALYPHDLATVLDVVQRFPREVALVRGLELCDGLAAIHGRGLATTRRIWPASVGTLGTPTDILTPSARSRRTRGVSTTSTATSGSGR